MNLVKFYSIIKSRKKSKVVTAVTSCVTSVTVIKSGFGIWFIDENSIICENAASSPFTLLILSLFRTEHRLHHIECESTKNKKR